VDKTTRVSKTAGALLFAGAVGALAASCYLYVSRGFGALSSINDGSMGTHVDFWIWWSSGAALYKGESIYYGTGAPASSLNPPIWTVLVSPAALLDPLVAYRAFVLLSVAAAVGYLSWTAKAAGITGGQALAAGTALLLSGPFLTTLGLGQIYPFLALCLAAAWVLEQTGRGRLAGCGLGAVVAIKPILAPLLLWPLLRRQWGTLAAAFGTIAAATLLGVLVAGPHATFVEYPKVLSAVEFDGNPVNASLQGTAARLFGEGEFARPVANAPWAVPVASVLGGLLVLLTTWAVRHDQSGLGLWAVAAASLLASPLAWHNYLVVLAPGILVLVGRGRTDAAMLLIALVLIPPEWVQMWEEVSSADALPVALALTLYTFILIAHWLAFLFAAARSR
jgi:alpha-1,2-mannosyltransferase